MAKLSEGDLIKHFDEMTVLELNDPPANTYTHEMMRELDNHIITARFDENVHVIVLRGSGDAGAARQGIR